MTSVQNDNNQGLDESKEHSAVFGMYLHREQAENAKAQLFKEGFSYEDVSMLAPQPWGRKDFVYHQRTTIREGALLGGIIGSIVAGFIGFMVNSDGLNEMQLTTATGAQSGSYIWILPSLVGSAIGLIFGGAFGALVGIGVPKVAAKRYGFYLKEGAVILSVQVGTAEKREVANRIFEKTGAEDISKLPDSGVWETIIKEFKVLSSSQLIRRIRLRAK